MPSAAPSCWLVSACGPLVVPWKSPRIRPDPTAITITITIPMTTCTFIRQAVSTSGLAMDTGIEAIICRTGIGSMKSIANRCTCIPLVRGRNTGEDMKNSTASLVTTTGTSDS